LGRDVLVFNLDSRRELADKIVARLQILAGDAGGDYGLRAVVSHARTILKYKAELDLLVQDLTRLPTAERAEYLLSAYNERYGRALRRADAYRVLLYLSCVTLLAGIAYALIGLRRSTRALNAANEGLERRVQERTAELSASNIQL